MHDALVGITFYHIACGHRVLHFEGFALAWPQSAGLAALAALEGDGSLSEYQPYWAARAALLASAGEIDAADAAYEQAIGLESDPAVRRFLQHRRAAMRGGGALK